MAELTVLSGLAARKADLENIFTDTAGLKGQLGPKFSRIKLYSRYKNEARNKRLTGDIKICSAVRFPRETIAATKPET